MAIIDEQKIPRRLSLSHKIRISDYLRFTSPATIKNKFAPYNMTGYAFFEEGETYFADIHKTHLY